MVVLTVWLHSGILKSSQTPSRQETDLQVLQLGQVGEGPRFDESQTVDILQRTAEIDKYTKNVKKQENTKQLLLQWWKVYFREQQREHE